MFSVQMASRGDAYQLYQNGLQIAFHSVTYIISSDMFVIGASVRRINLEIMTLLTCNTPGGITTHIQCSTIPTPRQLAPNSPCAMFTENSTCFDIFPVLCTTCRGSTSIITCRSASLITSRSRFSTSRRDTNSSTG